MAIMFSIGQTKKSKVNVSNKSTLKCKKKTVIYKF